MVNTEQQEVLFITIIIISKTFLFEIHYKAQTINLQITPSS